MASGVVVVAAAGDGDYDDAVPSWQQLPMRVVVAAADDVGGAVVVVAGSWLQQHVGAVHMPIVAVAVVAVFVVLPMLPTHSRTRARALPLLLRQQPRQSRAHLKHYYSGRD